METYQQHILHGFHWVFLVMERDGGEDVQNNVSLHTFTINMIKMSREGNTMKNRWMYWMLSFWLLTPIFFGLSWMKVSTISALGYTNQSFRIFVAFGLCKSQRWRTHPFFVFWSRVVEESCLPWSYSLLSSWIRKSRSPLSHWWWGFT